MTQHLKVAIFGDWHHNTRWAVEALRAAAAAGATHYIHVGDHGAYWPSKYWHPALGTPNPQDEFTATNIELTDELGLTGFIVDGNHDNHESLRALPVDDEGFGVLSPHLRYARRGTRITLGGRKFGFLGGAFSIDLELREEGLSVWEHMEQVTPEDVRALGSEPLDVLITHDVPMEVMPHKMFNLPDHLEKRSEISRHLISKAVEATRPAMLFAGHWHQRGTHFVHGTQVEILDREFRGGNAVLLDTETMTIQPLSL